MASLPVAFWVASTLRPEEAESVASRHAHHPGAVFALHPSAGVQESMDDVPFVAEEQEPLRVPVEAPHVVEPGGFRGQDVVDGAAAVRVGTRGEDARGLVEGDPADLLDRLHHLVVHLHTIAAGNHPRSQLHHHLPVDPDPSGHEQSFRFPAGRSSRHGKILLNPDSFSHPDQRRV